MTRKRFSTLLAIILSLLGIFAAFLPERVKEENPWLWQVVILLIILLFLFLILFWFSQILKFLSKKILPVRIIQLLINQKKNRSAFLYFCKHSFIFLPLFGGVNLRKWSYEFNIVSCLLKDLVVDEIALEITYPVTGQTATIRELVNVKSLSMTQIKRGQSGLTDDAFHQLSDMAKVGGRRKQMSFNLKVTGYFKKNAIFVIDDSYNGYLEDWGQNNPGSQKVLPQQIFQ